MSSIPGAEALRDPAPPASWPRWGFGGAARCRHQPNGGSRCRSRQEAIINLISAAVAAAKPPQQATSNPKAKKGRCGLEAVARHRHAAITRRGDDCRHDAGDRLAATLGPGLPGRRRAQTSQAEARSKKVDGAGCTGLRAETAARPASQLQAPVVLNAMPRVRIGPALPDRKHLDAEIARLRDLGVSELRSRWHTVFGRRPPPHLPRHLLFRVLAYRLQAEQLGDLDPESHTPAGPLGVSRAGRTARRGPGSA